MITYLDSRKTSKLGFNDCALYTKHINDAVDEWRLGPAKDGDVGMDLPVRIKHMLTDDLKPMVHLAADDVTLIKPPAWLEGQVGDLYAKLLADDPSGHGDLRLWQKYLVDYNEGYVIIPPNGYAELPTNLRVKLPKDTWGMIRPRSSTGWKRRLHVFEGTIDEGFTGHLRCLVFNPNREAVKIMDGDRLAQLIIVPRYPLGHIITTNELPSTARGETGFGSSGS